MPVWSIEGIPGVGKSSVLAKMKGIRAIGGNPVIVLDEPLDEWNTVIDDNNNTLFELFYKDPTKHAFAFQMLVLVTRVKLLKKTIDRHPDAHIFTERCPASDRLFAKQLFVNGAITQEQYAVYNKAWKLLDAVPIYGHFYIRADAAVALERCLKRGREGEQLTLEYLQVCREHHETWIRTLPKCLELDAQSNPIALANAIVCYVKPKQTPLLFDLLVAAWIVSFCLLSLLLFME